MNHLVSFADSRMQLSLNRLGKQARDMGVFESIRIMNENKLPFDFKEHLKDKLIPGSRGYGYWSWKPEIILLTLDEIQDGDGLVYVDAGCHLNHRGRKRLLEYFKILNEEDSGIVAFQACKPTKENSSLKYDGRKLFDQPNYRWIKGDLFDYFGVRDNQAVINSEAIGAGIIFIRKCDRAISIIREWRQIVWQRFDLLDDTPSVSPNISGFIEHRHDQAIWTLLCLKHGVKTLSAYEYWYPKKNKKKLMPDWSALSDFPIHARRDKDFGLVRNFYQKVVLKLNRIKSELKKIKFNSEKI